MLCFIQQVQPSKWSQHISMKNTVLWNTLKFIVCIYYTPYSFIDYFHYNLYFILSGGFFLLCSHFVSLTRLQCEVIIIPSVKLVWFSVPATQFSPNVIRTTSKMRISQSKSHLPRILQILDLLWQVIQLVFCHRFITKVFRNHFKLILKYFNLNIWIHIQMNIFEWHGII